MRVLCRPGLSGRVARSLLMLVMLLPASILVEACSTDPAVFTSGSNSDSEPGDAAGDKDSNSRDIGALTDIRNEPDTRTSPDATAGDDARAEADAADPDDAGSEPDALADSSGETDAEDPGDAGEQTPPDPGKCRDTGDCQSGGQSCLAPGEFSGCGACQNFLTTCSQDSDCNSGFSGRPAPDTERPSFICQRVEPSDCACDTSIKICKAACTENSECGTGEECSANGRCVRAACTKGNDAAARGCPPHFSCTGASLQQFEDATSATCERAACDTDADCTSAGGTCVKRRCYAEFGTCELPRP